MKRMTGILLAALLLFAALAKPVSAEETERLYMAQPSAGSGGYCVLTLRDVLYIEPDESFSAPVTWSSLDPAAVPDALKTSWNMNIVVTDASGVIIHDSEGSGRSTDYAFHNFVYYIPSDTEAMNGIPSSVQNFLNFKTHNNGRIRRF